MTEISWPHRIVTSAPRKLVGQHLTMSLADNHTFRLWQQFRSLQQRITNPVSADLFSVQIYPNGFDFTFSTLHSSFVKWAAIEVLDFQSVPPEMSTLDLPGGLYAVFNYQGLPTDPRIFRYIYGEWLPNSPTYTLDHRPHFEILGNLYRHNDPQSEEEIWIPIKTKA
ncbi:AraC family transcriptional regulator [Dyadobacter jejuensis]|uniref:AraC family transcriptional regulator n=1 Tax=Dyadobacter jejuensis TaxID=1082580 RepID=A0A316ASQ6_9BACT|nr:GyrI-like domain-containing protein [Dyadobacter jejuensis]PWJ60558.1 AraC family transcriptional regulator [Dyadobacter jejuensis]